jgi:hypothetical protein
MALVALIAAVTVAGRLTLPEAFTCVVDGVRGACSEVPPLATAVALVAILGSVALVLTALHRLARLFGHYAHGDIFTRASVGEIRMLGYVAVAYALFQLVLFVGTLFLRAGGGSEWPTELHFDLPLGAVFMAGFVMLLSWVMDVGAELREENELTV